jgi:flagellar FliL protein
MPPPKAEAAAASAAAKHDAKAEAPAAAPAAAPAPAPRGALATWLPAVLTLLLAPVATWATVEFVVLPRLQKKIAAATPGEHGANPEAAAPAAEGHEGKNKDGKESEPAEFKDVIVNLAGTMGTRLLKASFVITGAPDIKTVFDGPARVKLTDVTLNVLSSLTLAEIEEPGAKNVIREKLVNSYNQALGRKVAEQVYFSDFVIQ